MKRSKLKISLLYLLSFVLSIGPVAVYFLMNMDRYVKTVSDKVKITVGIALLLIIVVLKVLGKLKVPSRAVLFGIVFILSYLLSSIINDLIVFSFLALLGEIMDSACQIFITREKENLRATSTAKKTALEVQRVLNGRV